MVRHLRAATLQHGKDGLGFPITRIGTLPEVTGSYGNVSSRSASRNDPARGQVVQPVLTALHQGTSSTTIARSGHRDDIKSEFLYNPTKKNMADPGQAQGGKLRREEDATTMARPQDH